MQNLIYIINNKQNNILIPNDASNVRVENKVYIAYDLPIGRFGNRTVYKHVGFKNSNLKIKWNHTIF